MDRYAVCPRFFAGACGRGRSLFEEKHTFFESARKLLIRALTEVRANIAYPNEVQYVRSNIIKGADQKFFAELFFKKATSLARRRL